MSEHLEAQRISRCVLGEQSRADGAHLAICAECRREVEEFERALRGLRGSVRRWSEQEFAAVGRPGSKPVGRPAVSAAWSMAVILLLSLLGWRFSFRHQPAAAPLFADSDAVLMDSVRADADRPVPRGMEPLQALP
jgi:hypothetical protein